MFLRIQNKTNDLEQSCHDMRQFWPDCRVSFNAAGPYISDVNGLILEKTTFSDNSTTYGLRIDNLRFESVHLLSIPITGVSSHLIRDQVYTANKNDAVFQQAGELISAWPETKVRTFQVTIDSKTLGDCILAYAGQENLSLCSLKPRLNLAADQSRSLSALTQYMIQWLNNPAFDFQENAAFLKAFEARFLDAFLESQSIHWLFLDRQKPAGPVYVSLAAEYMRANVRAELDMTELANLCGVSGRSLQLGFRRYLGQSPTQFYRDLRLQAVHEALKNRQNHRSVSRIAYDYGFLHLGRFSRDYRRKFLENPAETRLKAK